VLGHKKHEVCLTQRCSASASAQCITHMAHNRLVRQYTGTVGQVQGLLFLPLHAAAEHSERLNFVSTSDVIQGSAIDKMMYVWDFEHVCRLGVAHYTVHSLTLIEQASIISNPVYCEAFTCPRLCLHPDQQHFVAQSNVNRVAQFSARSPVKLNRKKVWACWLTKCRLLDSTAEPLRATRDSRDTNRQAMQ
jgi:hypothetical protein